MKFSLLAKFSLVSAFLIVTIAIALAWGVQYQLEQVVLRHQAEDTADQVTSILNPNLHATDLAGPLDPARYAQIDALIRQHVIREHIVRVKIWNRDGLILYSDEKDLVGRRFPMSEELEQALAGKIAMEVSSLEREENIAERGRYTQLLEVYVPLQPTDSPQVVGAYEIYHDWAVLEPGIAEMRRLVWSSVGLGFLILYVSLFTLVRNASRELVRRNEENARLYEEAKQRLAERKQAEEEKEKLQAQLLQAQKMEAVGRLTAGIAHDFNNLLTAINGFAELTQFQLPTDDALQEPLGKILDSGRRAADLVRQLLTFSRKQIIEPQVLDLNAVVSDMGRMLQRIIGEHIELQTVLAPVLWPVKVDPAQIEQVIVNLAVNARDALPDGGHLTVETANVTLDEDNAAQHLDVQPGEYVRLAVSDDGIGMSEEVKARLFEPFFTTKDVGKGTGLGLATVHGIVKQSGGDIRVYSEEGQGTTFKIYLPRVEGAIAPLTRSDQAGDLPLGMEMVLLVEDDVSVRELIARILRQQGYTVLAAASGQEALRLSQEHGQDIQLLLTDVVMPGMSGKALADQLVQIQPGLRILFMSGYTDDAIAQHGVLEPGIAFLSKPFSPLALARKVRAVLDGQ